MTPYGQKLKDPRWQRKRLEVMGRDHFTCRLCGDNQSMLNVHHLLYERGADPWDYPGNSLITTCEDCHQELHAMQFGPAMVQALIAGGANIDVLHGFLMMLQMRFEDGPLVTCLSADKWEAAIDAISACLQTAAERE